MNRVEALTDVVASSILTRAEETSSLLRDLGIPHALIGGPGRSENRRVEFTLVD